MDSFLDAGELLKMDHRIQVALKLDDTNTKLINEEISARWDVSLEDANPQAFIQFRRLKALGSEPELQQLLTEGEVGAINVSLRYFHRPHLFARPYFVNRRRYWLNIIMCVKRSFSAEVCEPTACGLLNLVHEQRICPSF